eukprot:PITA_03334
MIYTEREGKASSLRRIGITPHRPVTRTGLPEANLEEEVTEAWLINMNKHFQFYEYDHNLKARLAIYQLQTKATLWWEEVKMIHGVSEQNVIWEKFQRYFKEKYLTKRLYDEKAKELHDLRLGQLSMNEFITKFTSLMRYVPNIREEKAKSGRIEVETTTRPLVQCWGCGGPHYVKNCPDCKGTDQVAQIQEESIVGEVARSIPKINSALKDHQAEYKSIVVEFEGKIFDETISILIDLGDTLSYISPKVVEQCHLQSVKLKNPWLVQLTTGAKRRLLAKVNNFPVKLVDQPIMADLKVLLLGSYDVIIGMDWLEKHWSLINCKDKTINYMDEYGLRQKIQGILRPLKIRPVTASQLAKCIQKGFRIYAIQVGYINSTEKYGTLENIPVVQDFPEMFPEKISGLPPKRNIDFTIELIPRVAPVSRAPYHMSVLELTKLKMQLQELHNKSYIRPSVSPWETLVLFVKRKDKTLRMCMDYR